MKLTLFPPLVIAAVAALSSVLVAGIPVESTNGLSKRRFRIHEAHETDNAFSDDDGITSGSTGNVDGGTFTANASDYSLILSGGLSEYYTLSIFDPVI